jgi:hypothetical protein
MLGEPHLPALHPEPLEYGYVFGEISLYREDPYFQFG